MRQQLKERVELGSGGFRVGKPNDIYSVAQVTCCTYSERTLFGVCDVGVS